MNLEIKHYCSKCKHETEHQISSSIPGSKSLVLCLECSNINGIMHVGNIYCNNQE